MAALESASDPLEDEVEPVEVVGAFVGMKPFCSGIALRLDLNGRAKAYIVRGATASDLIRMTPHPGDFLQLSINALKSTGAEFVVEVHKLVPQVGTAG